MGTKSRWLILMVNKLKAELSFQFLLRQPEHSSHSFVCPDDPMLVVQDHNHVGNGVKRLFPILVGPPQSLLDPLVLGDLFYHGHEIQQFSLEIMNRRKHDTNPDNFTAFLDVALLYLVRRNLFFQQLVDMLPSQLEVVRVGEIKKGELQELFFGISKHFSQFRIDRDPLQIRP